MKRSQLITYIAASLVVLGFIGVGVYAMTRPEKTAAVASCEGVRAQSHEASIENDTVTPKYTAAKRCDTLTITNKDSKERMLAFGYHNKHVAYDGQEEKTLQQNDSVTVTLKETGEYHYHDHYQDEVEGFFTVTE